VIWQILSGVLALVVALLVGVLLGSRRRSSSPRPDKNLEVRGELGDEPTNPDAPPLILPTDHTRPEDRHDTTTLPDPVRADLDERRAALERRARQLDD